MGRWANFVLENGNEVEYKFWFGYQSSEDIEEFGGTCKISYNLSTYEEYMDMEDESEKEEFEELKKIFVDDDTYYEKGTDEYDYAQNLPYTNYAIDWCKDEVGSVLEKVKEIAVENGFMIPNWDEYDATQKGIDKIVESVWEGVKDCGEDKCIVAAKFALGCVIYILLSNQEETLSAHYEII